MTTIPHMTTGHSDVEFNFPAKTTVVCRSNVLAYSAAGLVACIAITNL